MNAPLQSSNVIDIKSIIKLCASIPISRSDLQRIHWLSGTPCGGKTTVSDAIAKKQNWNVYHVDEH